MLFDLFITVIAYDPLVCTIFETILWYLIIVNDNFVLVPLTQPSIPWDDRPILLSNDLLLTSLYFGHWMRCRYSNSLSNTPSNTVSAYSDRNSKGNLRAAVFMAVNFAVALEMSNTLIIASCVTDLVTYWDLVFLAGGSSFPLCEGIFLCCTSLRGDSL